jgi:hypothetical protein
MTYFQKDCRPLYDISVRHIQCIAVGHVLLLGTMHMATDIYMYTSVQCNIVTVC